jgi:hypothetical protein
MDAMMKIVSLSVRLITLAAILIPMQYALKQMKNQKGMGGMMSAAGSLAGATAQTAVSDPPKAGTENNLPSPLAGMGPAAMLPQMLGISAPTATTEQTAQPEKSSGPATLIHCPAGAGKNGKRPGVVVMKLPPDANAAVIDGRVQLFKPATKTNHGH